MNAASLLHYVLALALSPLLFGIINRTKALIAGRQGPPWRQPYYDLYKLLNKGVVYSRATSWIFQAMPSVGLAAVLLALALVPCGGSPALLTGRGDWFLMIGLLGLARFFLVLAALDTGSSFEGMGASREVLFSALAEPALLVGLAALARATGALSLSDIYPALAHNSWGGTGPVVLLAASALLVVLLAENARIPVDDPNTHLELTMIHEVMVLDVSGPDLALVHYTSGLKLWLFSTLLTGMLLPLVEGHPLLNAGIAYGGLAATAVAVGLIESAMARLRLIRVPQLLAGASALSILAFVLVMR
ncbi:MAG: respiratory chain complex I subunit 1 family protein [bacterium]